MRMSLFNPEFNYDPVQHYFKRDKLDYFITVQFLSNPINTVKEYRQWVKSWKIAYNNLTLIIRAHKKARKKVNFPEDKMSQYFDFVAANECDIAILKRNAKSLLELRKINKIRYPSLVKEDELI